MVVNFWCIGALIAFILIQTTNGNSIGGRRIKQLEKKIVKVQKWLSKIERKELECNKTMYSVSVKVDEVSDILSQVYQGPLYAKLDLSEGYDSYRKVLLTLPDAMKRCVDSYKGTLVKRDRAQITCLQQIMWRYEEPLRARELRRYRRIVTRTGVRINFNVRPPPRLRLRKEYRVLTQVERERFNDGMNHLAQTGVIAAFAEIHRLANLGAHGGPAFLPWHRAFLFYLENELRKYDNRITLPYWASSMDDARENPLNSVMWTSQLVGNGIGQVITGPFAGWSSKNDYLRRAYGINGNLVSKAKIANMMTKCDFEDITDFGVGGGQYRLEQFHNGVHNWVGGDMQFPGTAPYDPVFYLHHCYIDYLWEKFRERQASSACPGIDRETNYPQTNQANQAFGDTLLLLDTIEPNSTVPPYTVEDGMSDWWTKYVYRYQDVPTCEDRPICGGSKFLMCHPIKKCCVPKSRFQGPTDIAPFPLPGLKYTTPDSYSYGYESTTPCDQYVDPGCYRSRSVAREKAGLEIQPYEELRILEQEVAINRGVGFVSDSNDGRNLYTMRDDLINYTRELREYRAEERKEEERREAEQARRKVIQTAQDAKRRAFAVADAAGNADKAVADDDEDASSMREDLTNYTRELREYRAEERKEEERREAEEERREAKEARRKDVAHGIGELNVTSK